MVGENTVEMKKLEEITLEDIQNYLRKYDCDGVITTKLVEKNNTETLQVFEFDADNRPHKTTIALPYKIGCGRGGADWEVVYKIIEEELSSFEVELWKLEEQNV